jgi:hypothetical protein
MSDQAQSDSAKPRPTMARSAKKSVKKSGRQEQRRKTPPPQEEGEPVVSGRMVIALALALAMSIIPVSGLGQYITKTSPQTAERATWSPGQRANVHLTVVTSDYLQLGCSDARAVGAKHCEFKNDRERWTSSDSVSPLDNNKIDILQPYRTTDRNLMLLPGLWAQPEVATRLHVEPPGSAKNDKLARFVVACDVKFLEEWDGPLIRWKTGERWSSQGKAMVAELISCKILEDHAD